MVPAGARRGKNRGYVNSQIMRTSREGFTKHPVKSLWIDVMKCMTEQFSKGDEPWTKGELLFNAIV
jgi:hypothetical protein